MPRELSQPYNTAMFIKNLSTGRNVVWLLLWIYTGNKRTIINTSHA
jgi:hypothetical protein